MSQGHGYLSVGNAGLSSVKTIHLDLRGTATIAKLGRMGDRSGAVAPIIHRFQPETGHTS